MRFTIDKNQLLKALNNASKAVAPKNPDAMLNNLKLDLNERGLEITGSNSEITVCSTVPYAVDGKETIRNAGLGAALVNARVFTDEIREMEGNEVTLEIIDDSIAKLSDGRTSLKLPSIRAEEYPDIDLEPNGTSLDIHSRDLIALVEQSAFAASDKDMQTRSVLTAVNLEAGDNQLIATATDSARLARKTMAIDSPVRFRCNIPARLLSDISRMFEDEDMVRLVVNENNILFLFGNSVVSSRLIAQNYPVTKSIIPQTFNYYLEVNAKELLSAMKRLSILSSGREPVVRLSMREDRVELSARSDVNGSANEPISTFTFTGERLEVSFNCLFMMDAIRALKCEDVTICFQAEMKPFVVKNPSDETVVELITPMREY